MNTKQITPKGILHAVNERWHITDVKPLPQLDWMTPHQQLWNVIPISPTGKRDESTNQWIYPPEQMIVCSDPTITFDNTHKPITVYIKDN